MPRWWQLIICILVVSNHVPLAKRTLPTLIILILCRREQLILPCPLAPSVRDYIIVTNDKSASVHGCFSELQRFTSPVEDTLSACPLGLRFIESERQGFTAIATSFAARATHINIRVTTTKARAGVHRPTCCYQ